MSDVEILQELRDAFADAAIPNVPAIEPALTFDAIAGLDSVSRARLIMSVEERFGVEISGRENSRLKTIGDLCGLIATKLPPA